MENAVDALKIAFAVMVFTMALTLAISTFSQARETSEAILFMNDKTNYYSWEDAENYAELDADGNIIEYKSQRIVGIESIIPTLYRYYKENYTVIFDGIDKPIYFLDSTKKWDKSYVGGYDDGDASTINDDKILYFDLNKEIQSNCPWVGTVNDIKKNLDLFLEGTTGYSFGNASRKVKYMQGFIEQYADATFLEELGEYATDRTYGMNEDGDLEIQNKDGEITVLKLNTVTDEWEVQGTNNLEDVDGNPIPGNSFKLDEIATLIGSSATTFMSADTNGEIIELAKPTIKRVIKYTKLP